MTAYDATHGTKATTVTGKLRNFPGMVELALWILYCYCLSFMGSLKTSWSRDSLDAYFYCLGLGLELCCLGLGLSLHLEKNVKYFSTSAASNVLTA